MRFTHPHQFDGMADEIDLVIDYDYEPAEPEVLHPIEDAYPGCAAEAHITQIQIYFNEKYLTVTDIMDQSFIEVLEEYCLMNQRSLSDVEL